MILITMIQHHENQESLVSEEECLQLCSTNINKFHWNLESILQIVETDNQNPFLTLSSLIQRGRTFKKFDFTTTHDPVWNRK